MIRPVALITGASSGIGKEFARQLARDYDLILIARRLQLLQSLKHELCATYSTDVEVIGADLVIADHVSNVASRVKAEQRLGLVINNAGYGLEGNFWDTDIAAHERMHLLHVTATLTLTHAAVRNFVPRDTGRIINVSSVAGFAWYGNASYGATKAWMIAFGNAVNVDLLAVESKVRVQTLCPGYTHTGFHEAMGADAKDRPGAIRWMTAKEVVSVSLKNLPSGKFVVVPGMENKTMSALIPRLPIQRRVTQLGKLARKLLLQKKVSLPTIRET